MSSPISRSGANSPGLLEDLNCFVLEEPKLGPRSKKGDSSHMEDFSLPPSAIPLIDTYVVSKITPSSASESPTSISIASVGKSLFRSSSTGSFASQTATPTPLIFFKLPPSQEGIERPQTASAANPRHKILDSARIRKKASSVDQVTVATQGISSNTFYAPREGQVSRSSATRPTAAKKSRPGMLPSLPQNKPPVFAPMPPLFKGIPVGKPQAQRTATLPPLNASLREAGLLDLPPRPAAAAPGNNFNLESF